MNNVSKQIRIPQDLRDTVTALHLNTTALVQRFLDSFRFYPYFSTRDEQEKSDTLSKIRQALTSFQHSGDVYVDPILAEINNKYCKLLIKLSNDRKLTPQAHDKQSRELIENWEKEIRPLINYPKDLMLEGGGKLYLSFNFMLCNVVFGDVIEKLMYMYMKRLSLVYLYAHDYAGNPCNNMMMVQFFNDLRDCEGVFLPRTTAHSGVTEKYEKKLADLYAGMVNVKNYNRRLKMFRPVIREWASKMKESNPAY